MVPVLWAGSRVGAGLLPLPQHTLVPQSPGGSSLCPRWWELQSETWQPCQVTGSCCIPALLLRPAAHRAPLAPSPLALSRPAAGSAGSVLSSSPVPAGRCSARTVTLCWCSTRQEWAVLAAAEAGCCGPSASDSSGTLKCCLHSSPAGTSSAPTSQKCPYGQLPSLFIPLGYYRAMKSQLLREWPLLTPQILHWNKYSWYL